MTQNPMKRKVSFEELVQDYGAVYFQDSDALGEFIARFNYPVASTATLNNRARSTLIPFHWVSVLHNVKFACSDTSDSDIVDAIYVRPKQTDSKGCTIPPPAPQFDTILVCGKQDNIHGVNGKTIIPIEFSSDQSQSRPSDSTSMRCI